MTQVHVRERRMTPPISLNALRRPLRRREQLPFSGADGRDALRRLLEQGGGQADAVAEAMAYALIHKAMAERLFDRRRGAVPEFMGRLRKAVGAFEAHIR